MKRRTRKTKRPASRRAAGGRAWKRSAKTATRTTPELAALIRALVAARRVTRQPTLGAVRAALQKIGVTWSREGELLFPQDRTAVLIELDELIEAHGARADASGRASRRKL